MMGLVYASNTQQTYTNTYNGRFDAKTYKRVCILPVTIYEERIIVFYGRAIPAICVTQNATQLESQKGASKHSH